MDFLKKSGGICDTPALLLYAPVLNRPSLLMAVFCLALNLRYGRLLVLREVRNVIALRSMRGFRVWAPHAGFCHHGFLL